ncbi:MAG TPA: glycogen-binding domain-containing protein [Longimicrobiales bacterium]|nr:glycogen-binding domain-containing protein [Longimicrobiales bacterium]
MDDRLHASLDGDLTPEDLTPAERAAKAAFDARVSRLRTDLDRHAPADIDQTVMRRIRDLGLEPLPAPAEPLLRRIAHSAWTAHEYRLSVRPVYGLAAAAVLAFVMFYGGALLGGSILPGTAADPAPGPAAVAPANVPAAPIYVQFRLEAGAASDVTLAGSFSDWQPTHTMQQSADGVWTILVPLAPGVHDYGFIVDGDRWVPDPYAPQVDDGFGGVNSRLTVLTPADRL